MIPDLLHLYLLWRFFAYQATSPLQYQIQKAAAIIIQQQVDIIAFSMYASWIFFTGMDAAKSSLDTICKGG